MVLRIQRIGDGFGVMLPAEMVEELGLREGAAADVVVKAPVNGAAAPEHRTMTVEEGMAAYRRIEPLHRNTLRELAK